MSHHLAQPCFSSFNFREIDNILHTVRSKNPVAVATTDTDALVHEVNHICENAREWLLKLTTGY